ncbi:MAG: acetyl-CoA decarbonylase/synthase complex subunit gamma [Firmicutes bacterium]|nr:acetyl-CoA decarbonylase/synthase complex subunit gamma [Bacillota bacterium]
MGLTGLEIYKLLPKKNCRECGPPTCLAFAMALAAGKASLDACPYVSDEARAALESASAPPIKLVTIGTGERKLDIGDETVLFRHDKTFFHETGLGFELGDAEGPQVLAEKARDIWSLDFERVGQHLRVNLIGVRSDTGEASAFGEAVKAVARAAPGLPLVLMAEDPGVMKAGLEVAGAARPLIYAATGDNWEAMAGLAREAGCPVAVRGRGLDELADLAMKVAGAGCKDLVLDSGSRRLSRTLADLTQIRRLAIKKKFRPFGYPTIAFVTSEDPQLQVAEAGVYVAKYASIVMMRSFERWQVLPLVTLRQNIYTDPQKPIQVEPKLYSIGGEAGPDAPLYVTSNFSLTFFTVQGDIEASKVPSHLLVIDTEGTSVLTAWAAGKFTAEKIADALATSGAADRVRHRKVVLPGYVAAMSGKLEEKSGWEVLVGPRESSGIPSFVKTRWGA